MTLIYAAPVTSREWFGFIAMGASRPVEARVLEQLEALLDRLHPVLVDPAESSAIDGTFTLTHQVDRTADIEITVHAHHAIVDGLLGPEEISDLSGEAGDAWMALSIAESIERLLRESYIVETTHLGRRLIRTVVTTDSERTAVVRSPLGHLPIPNRFLRRSHRNVSYGVAHR